MNYGFLFSGTHYLTLYNIMSNAERKTHAPTVRVAAAKHEHSKFIKIVFTKSAMPQFHLHVNLPRKSHTM